MSVLCHPRSGQFLRKPQLVLRADYRDTALSDPKAVFECELHADQTMGPVLSHLAITRTFSRPKAVPTTESPFTKPTAAETSQSQVQRHHRDEVEEAMLASVLRNDPTGARAAIECGADVNERDGYGRTPLHRAALRGHVEVLDLLLGAGADVEAMDNYGNTSLHCASYRGRNAAVARLVEAGANLHARGQNARTPLQRAADNGELSTLALLHTLGAQW